MAGNKKIIMLEKEYHELIWKRLRIYLEERIILQEDYPWQNLTDKKERDEKIKELDSIINNLELMNSDGYKSNKIKRNIKIYKTKRINKKNK